MLASEVPNERLGMRSRVEGYGNETAPTTSGELAAANCPILVLSTAPYDHAYCNWFSIVAENVVFRLAAMFLPGDCVLVAATFGMGLPLNRPPPSSVGMVSFMTRTQPDHLLPNV